MAEMHLNAAQRRALLIRRPWTTREREVVLQGFWGRCGIAIEPVLGSIVFLVLTVGMALRGLRVPETATGSYCISAIFSLGFLGFVVYGVCVMANPVRALLSTREPIFIVDGYIRIRRPDEDSDVDSNGYVAVLTTDYRVACEWPTKPSGTPLEPMQRSAHVEFSEYGGVHRIDGLNTGVLPDTMTALGIGLNQTRR